MNAKYSLALCLSSLCSLCLCGSSLAALDAEAREPYRLRIVVRVAPHRLLTPVFADQLKRELRDSLQAAFGKMANVEVVEEHPQLKAIEERGLQAALDSFEKEKAGVDAVKTHFVLVDYIDGQYVVQTGQYDGSTNLASPAVRVTRTADRPFVARLAARLVERDFGVVGTVTKKIDDQTVEVTLKASLLETNFDRSVAKDDVFALAQVGRGGATRVDESLLQVVQEPKDGVCVCRVFNRYKDARLTEGGGVLGYRCLKLGTSARPTPLRLRFLDLKGVPVDGLQIEVSGTGFDRKEDFKYQGITRDGGWRDTEDKYRGAAFVRVLHNRVPIAQLPVAVIEGRTVICRVNVNDQGGALALLQIRRRTFFDRLTETLRMQADLRDDLGKLVAAGKQDAALTRAKDGLKSLRDDVRDYETELTNLTVDAKAAGANFNLAIARQRIEELRASSDDLQKDVGQLEESLTRQRTDAKNKELFTLVSLARLQRGKTEFEMAIKTYEDALTKHGPNAQVQKELDALKEEWGEKGPDHARARNFVYDTWPRQDRTHRLKGRMDEAQKALDALKKANDKLTAQKLMLVNNAHIDRLNKEAKTLKPDEREDDRAQLKLIGEVAGDLQKLHEDVLEFLGIKKPAK